jgi:hypothetical protein
MVFDSTCTPGPTGGDPDLCVPGQGNVLIVSEDGEAGDPDDNAGGFQITIDFTDLETGSVNLQNLKGVDVDPNEKMRFQAFNATGGLVAESFICGANVSDPDCDDTVVSGDNTVASVFPDLVEDVAILTIDHDSSGAIDDIGFDTIVQLNY